MNSGATAERVYETLKRMIMKRAFRPGERLDPAALADSLSSSVTPVRDALHLLTGEGLVAARVGEGFHLPPLDQPGLSDLYAFTAQILMLAIRASPGASSVSTRSALRPGDGGAAERAAAIFQAIADRSMNGEHRLAMASLNARLNAVRMVEPHILGPVEDELQSMEDAFLTWEPPTLRRLVMAYHRRRRRNAAELVRAAYRADQGGR